MRQICRRIKVQSVIIGAFAQSVIANEAKVAPKLMPLAAVATQLKPIPPRKFLSCNQNRYCRSCSCNPNCPRAAEKHFFLKIYGYAKILKQSSNTIFKFNVFNEYFENFLGNKGVEIRQCRKRGHTY